MNVLFLQRIKNFKVMKKFFYIAMIVALVATTTFNIVFAYSNVDCVGCATMLFVAMTIFTSIFIAWGTRELYKMYEEGKLNLFK